MQRNGRDDEFKGKKNGRGDRRNMHPNPYSVAIGRARPAKSGAMCETLK
jgi:hypothetical protein